MTRLHDSIKSIPRFHWVDSKTIYWFDSTTPLCGLHDSINLSRLHESIEFTPKLHWADSIDSTPRLQWVDSTTQSSRLHWVDSKTTTSLSRLYDSIQSTPRLHEVASIVFKISLGRLHDSTHSTPWLHAVHEGCTTLFKCAIRRGKTVLVSGVPIRNFGLWAKIPWVVARSFSHVESWSRFSWSRGLVESRTLQ